MTAVRETVTKINQSEPFANWCQELRFEIFLTLLDVDQSKRIKDQKCLACDSRMQANAESMNQKKVNKILHEAKLLFDSQIYMFCDKCNKWPV